MLTEETEPILYFLALFLPVVEAAVLAVRLG
jgi:hypothetical protein